MWGYIKALIFLFKIAEMYVCNIFGFMFSSSPGDGFKHNG